MNSARSGCFGKVELQNAKTCDRIIELTYIKISDYAALHTHSTTYWSLFHEINF